MSENAVGKTKNILLTTISTMNNPGINCYRVKDNEGKTYLCAGISQQEPGSKYFFKNNRIDRVVAICSDEVMGKAKEDEAMRNDKETKDFRDEWYNLKERWEESKDVYAFTSVDFYKLRLGAFLYDTEFDNSMLKDFIAASYHKDSFDDVDDIENERIIGNFEYDEEKAGKMIECLTEQKLVEDKEVVKYINGYLSPVRWNYDNESTKMLYEEFCKGQVDGNEDLKKYVESFDKNYGKSYLWFKVYQTAEEEDRVLKAKEDYPLEFVSVKDQYSNGVANINGIIEAIKKDYDNDDINVFIDVQGGSRTSQFTVYNVMQILSDEAKYQEAKRGQMLHVCATYYNPRKLWMNEIVDETPRYNIINAVSGMNAFIRFGRTKALQTYFSATKNKDITELKELLTSFEDSLLRNRTEKLQESLIKIYNLTRPQSGNGEVDGNQSGEKHESNILIEEMYCILKDQIYRSLEGLVDDEGKLDYVNLVDWCFDHNHILQAYTIAESKMPEYIIKNNILHIDERVDYLEAFYILSFAKDSKLKLSEFNNDTLIMERNVKTPVDYYYNNPYHYIIARYLNSNSTDSREHLTIYMKSKDGSKHEDIKTIKSLIGPFEELASYRNKLAHGNDQGNDNKNPGWPDLKQECENYRYNDASDHINPELDNLKISKYFKRKGIDNDKEKSKEYEVMDRSKANLFKSLLKVIKRDLEYWKNNESDRIYFLDYKINKKFNDKLCRVIWEYGVVKIIEGKLASKEYNNELLRLLWNAVFADEIKGFVQHVTKTYKPDESVREDIPQIEIPTASIEKSEDKTEQINTVKEVEEMEEAEDVGYDEYDRDGMYDSEEYSSGFDAQEIENNESAEEEPQIEETEDTDREAEHEEELQIKETEDINREQAVNEKAGFREDDNKAGYEYLRNEITKLNARVKELEWQVNNLEKQNSVEDKEHKSFLAKLFRK